MTPGDISFLIIAIAILALVLFIGYFLVQLSATLNSVTQDVKLIAHDADDLLINTNDLLKDVNGKMITLDPVFQAAGDLGTSVSELNASAQKIKEKAGKKKSGLGSNLGTAVTTASMLFNLKNKNKQKGTKGDKK
ncbi:DUF948 domain-containing protein [Weissella coleopterorum]|uniref:DUF948 domain-containing protein n=1 Tax=Weissella coleopterorum TaxID=2714949 RepID=A0A6G8B141_9LACO|nr:DUF948 domain-containing protein [Weissella coleopterorum]QIL50957.1 DUF948 domain-containing protein [Weissella coleopterorum]